MPKIKMRHSSMLLRFSISILLLFTLSLQQGLGQSGRVSRLTEDALTGTWKLDNQASLAHMSKEAKSMLAKMNAASKRAAKSSFNNQEFTFRANGMFSTKESSGHVFTGKWLISNSGKEVTITYESGAIRKYKVIKNLRNKVVLQLSKNTSRTVPMLSEWHLIKQ